MKSRNRVVKSPNVPINVQISTQVGWNMPHADGMKSRASVVAMMTKRSNHIPMFGNWTMIQTHTKFVRKNLNQKNWGEMTLQNIIAQ